MSRFIRRTCTLLALVTLTGTLYAQIAPTRPEAITAKTFQHSDLRGQDFFEPVGTLPKSALTWHPGRTSTGTVPCC